MIKVRLKSQGWISPVCEDLLAYLHSKRGVQMIAESIPRNWPRNPGILNCEPRIYL